MKKLLLGLFAILAMSIVGCGGGELLDAPEITMVVMDSTSITVMWEADTTIENAADFAGYNVYVSTDSASLVVEDGEDLNMHNASTITDNSYTITGLTVDSVYFIQVRTVNTEDKVGGYHDAKPVVKASPRPEFTVTLTLELAPGNANEPDCALRFETGAVLPESAGVFPGADVFFERFVQATEETLQVNSASRRTAPNFTPRTTLMFNYGIAHIDSVYTFDTGAVTEDHVPFVLGDLVIFMTEEHNYVKLHIDAYDQANATIQVTYAYQDNPDLPVFAPRR